MCRPELVSTTLTDPTDLVTYVKGLHGATRLYLPHVFTHTATNGSKDINIGSPFSEPFFDCVF